MTQRQLLRLQAIEDEQHLIDCVLRLADRYGLAPEEVMRETRETAARVARSGHDAEIRRMAQEFGTSEEEMRAEVEAEVQQERAGQ